jgi:hypothetical protein
VRDKEVLQFREVRRLLPLPGIELYTLVYAVSSVVFYDCLFPPSLPRAASGTENVNNKRLRICID